MNKSTNACSNLKFHCCYEAGNSGDIFLTSSMVFLRRYNDVILTSLSVYLLTVLVNLVYVKLCGLTTKTDSDKKTCMILSGVNG